MTDGKIRCAWCGDDPLYVAYHDQEWGRPLHDEQKLFELLVLEGMQAGLSWITILRKRENFRNAFDKFAVEEVASYGAEEITRLLGNAGIIRNRLKITAAVQNANAFLRVQKAFGTFDKYIWQFVGGEPIIHRWRSLQEIPARIKEADAMSKDLLARGFKFVGPTICYAFMQAAGLVNDHVVDCYCYPELDHRDHARKVSKRHENAAD